MILVVEDHKDTRDALVEFLRLHEFHTRGARDGNEALDLMKAEVPYIVILDWHMPLKSGLEVLREMRQQPNLKNTAVIFYTADPQPSLKAEAFKEGALKVLDKGSEWQHLVNELAELTSVRPDLYQR